METAYNKELEPRVTSVEKKAKKINDSKNTEQRVESVADSINRVNSRLDEIESKAEELEFYVEVLESVFGGSRSDCMHLETHISSAEKAANIADVDLLAAAEDLTFTEIYNKLDASLDKLDTAIKVVTDHIENEYTKEWNEELESARELNSIIGSRNDDFVSIIRNMRTFVQQEVWKTSKSVSSLEARWDRLTSEWESKSGKQGWEEFRKRHGLSNRTIRELKQFTGNDPVKLSDLSMETLEEIKSVDELESALQVEIRS